MKAPTQMVAAIATVSCLVAAGTALASPQAGSYTGATSQTGGTVTFRVSKSGTDVKGFSAEMFVTCTQGTAIQDIHLHVNPTPDMKIHKGAFGFHSKFTIDNGTTVIANGNGVLSGKFTSKKKATGSFHFPWTFDNRAGSFKGFRCDAGKVTFQASAR